MEQYLENMAAAFDAEDGTDGADSKIRRFVANYRRVSAYCNSNGGGPPGMESGITGIAFRLGIASILTMG